MSFDFIASAKRTFAVEAQAVADLAIDLNNNFNKACELLLHCRGRIIVTGMGKSGHIANKIAATLSSLGSPSFFLHPAEASHGDIGMITAEDVVIAISYSGSSDEIINLIPALKRIQCPLITFTGNSSSLLAQYAHVNLNIKVQQEACPLGLAPTSSTTASLAMGDAIAVALLEAKGFTAEQFALSHPSGSLGKRLLLKVSDIMRVNDKIPIVSSGILLKSAIIEMNAKGLGVTAVVNEQNQLCGIFTDGDLRRVFEDDALSMLSADIDQLMSTHPKTVSASTMAIDALLLMESNKITSLMVVDQHQHIEGVLHLHDLLDIGL